MSDPTTHRRRPPPAHRLALLGSVCALLLTTCAPGLSAVGRDLPDGEGETLRVTTRRLGVPAGDGAPPDVSEAVGSRIRSTPTPAGGGVEAEPVDFPDFPEVTAQRPALILSGDAGETPDLTTEALGVDGVSAASAFERATLPLDVGEDEAVTVALVDPAEFRVLTPQVTAEAVDVWQRVHEGDAAVTHDVGHQLKVDHGIDLGERVPVLDGAEGLRVGAYASNGVPPVAEVVVSEATGRALGLEGEATLLVALDEGVDPESVLPALEQATGLAAEVIPEPQTRRAFLSGDETNEAFEPFTYVSLGDGMVEIDPDWVRRNIVRAQVPVFRGEVICHRLMIPQLRGALREIVDEGLDHLIDTSDYGGCWVPRHVLFNPDRGLSMHAWGLAIDVNVQTNRYGAAPQMDRRIVEIFERWGFAWGGHWSTPDGMHFELAALLDVPE